MSRLETQIKALEEELRKAHQRIEELELFKKEVETRDQQQQQQQLLQLHPVASNQETDVLESDVSSEDPKTEETQQHTAS